MTDSRRRRRRRQHTPVTVADLREALAAYTGEDSPVGLDPTRHVYVRVGGPDGHLHPMVGVTTSTLLGQGIVILDGTAPAPAGPAGDTQ